MKSALLHKILKGKRVSGFVVSTVNFGNVLVVRKLPKDISITTNHGKPIASINQAIAQSKAGWILDDELYDAVKNYKCTKVVFYTKKPGILYETDAKNYSTGGSFYMAQKSKSGSLFRCVGVDKFNLISYKVKI